MPAVPRSLGLAAWAVCALAASPLAVTAQAAPWTSLGPFGGAIQALTVSPSGTVYAAGESVFRSADAGGAWTVSLTERITGGAVVDPVRPAVVYALTSTGVVYKSNDGGVRWRPVGSGLPTGRDVLLTLVVDPASRNHLYVGGQVGLYRSLDGGASWQSSGAGLSTTSEPARVAALAAVRTPAGTVFAGTAEGLFRSTDGAGSWRQLTQGLPASPVRALATAPSDPRTLYALFDADLFRSRDGGATWQRASRPPSPDGKTYSLVVDPRSAVTLYAGIPGGVLRSADGGQTWVRVGSPPGTDPMIVTADPQVSRRLYAGPALAFSSVPGGVFRSDDAGASWQRRSEGLAAFDTASMGIAQSDPNQVWTGLNTGRVLFRSGNQGRRWVRLNNPPNQPSPLAPVAAASASVAFVKTFSPVQPFFSILWRTEDAGASWRPSLFPSIPPVLLTYRLAPSDPSTLYALVFNGRPLKLDDFLRSTNGGASWDHRATLDRLNCGDGNLAVAPSDALDVYALGSSSTPTGFCDAPASRVLHSQDGGATWTDASAGLPPGAVKQASVDPHDPDVVYADVRQDFNRRGAGVWKTADGGASWTRTGSALDGKLVTALLSSGVPGRAYAAVLDGVIFRTDDGGATWRDVTGGLAARVVHELAADPGDPRHVYAATTTGIWTLLEE